MVTKEEALKLANDLEELHEQDLIDGVAHLSMPQASAMIRRLVEELEFQKKANIELLIKNTYSNRTIELLQQDTPQTKPLSDEEIYEIGKQHLTQYEDGLINFAKAIEERHGIK